MASEAIKHISVDLDTISFPPVVFVHQGDTWRQIYCSIYMDGVRMDVSSSTETATYSAVLPDENGVLSKQKNKSCTITGNQVIVDLSKVTISGHGEGYITVKITSKADTSKHYRPNNIRLRIQKSADQ